MRLRSLAGIGILAATTVLPTARWTTGMGGNETCPQIVHAALASTERYCEGTGRNKVCYGNVRVEVEPRAGRGDFVFAERGDTVDVADVQSLRTTAMNVRTGEWGIALMRLQALRASGSAANLTVVLMGDAVLEQPRPLAPAYVSDADALATADGPMYAFSFRSGEDDAQCSDVPESGMLVQTPEGVAEVTLLINEVDVQLGSTVYFQAKPNRALEIYVLEGHANVTAQGATETIPAGAQAAVPLDQNGQPAGPPSDAKPYEPEQVANAPLPLLERPVEIAPPADDGNETVDEPPEIPSATPEWSIDTLPTVETPIVTPTFEPTDLPPTSLPTHTPGVEAEGASPSPTPPGVGLVAPPGLSLTADPRPNLLARGEFGAPADRPVNIPGKGPDADKSKPRGPDRLASPTRTPGPPQSPVESLPEPEVPPGMPPLIWWVDWPVTPLPTPAATPEPIPLPTSTPLCGWECATPVSPT